MGAMVRLRGNSGPELDGHEPDRRRAARNRISRGVSIGSSGSQACEAIVRDASVHGCRVDSHADWLRLGAFISIRANDDAIIMGIVRWVRDGSAGVEFLQPVQPDSRTWRALLDDRD